MKNKTKAAKTGEHYGWIAFTLFFIGMAFLLFTRRGTTPGQNDFGLSFLLIPTILPLFAILTKQVLPLIFKGTFVKPLSDSILFFAIGIALFTLISRPPSPPAYNNTIYYLLLLTFMPILARLNLFFLPKESLLQVFLRSLIFFLSGLILRFSLLRIPWGGLIELESGEALLKIPLANIIFWSFTLTSFTVLFSLLSSARFKHLALAGKYIGLSPLPKFFFYLFILTYFISFRSYLGSLFPLLFTVIEWVLLVVVCLLLMLSISKKTRSFIQKADYAQWRKHKQKIEIDAGDELSELTAYIDDFVERNDKKGFLIYVTSEALQQNLSVNKIKGIVSALLDYTSEPEPKLITANKYGAFEEKNQTARRIVIDNTIEKLKQKEARI